MGAEYGESISFMSNFLVPELVLLRTELPMPGISH
jgi:hypothetical protein